jgi:hypothetical protein
MEFPLRAGPHTDPIWMEYVLKEVEVELEVKQQLAAVQFEVLAAMHSAFADGARKAAGILAKGERAG